MCNKINMKVQRTISFLSQGSHYASVSLLTLILFFIISFFKLKRKKKIWCKTTTKHLGISDDRIQKIPYILIHDEIELKTLFYSHQLKPYR